MNELRERIVRLEAENELLARKNVDLRRQLDANRKAYLELQADAIEMRSLIQTLHMALEMESPSVASRYGKRVKSVTEARR